MCLIVIEKVDGSKKEIIESNNRYCMLALAGFALAIFCLFIPGKYAIYILPFSLIMSIMGKVRIARTWEKGKVFATIGVFISLVYIILYIGLLISNDKVYKDSIDNTTDKVVNSVIKDVACSMINQDGYYSRTDGDGTITRCIDYQCTISKNGTVQSFSCLNNE